MHTSLHNQMERHTQGQVNAKPAGKVAHVQFSKGVVGSRWMPECSAQVTLNALRGIVIYLHNWRALPLVRSLFLSPVIP